MPRPQHVSVCGLVCWFLPCSTTGLAQSGMKDMEYPKALNCLTFVHQFHSKQGRCNGLDKRVQGRFLKGSFLATKKESFFADGV